MKVELESHSIDMPLTSEVHWLYNSPSIGSELSVKSSQVREH